MCIAILNKKTKLSENSIYNSWQNNEMGGGLLYNQNGKLKVFKTYKYNDFLNEYNNLRNQKNVGAIVLHFRIATSGIDGIENIHPFKVNDNLGFVHNGVISGLGNVKHSDTFQFNEILQGFKHDFIKCKTSKMFINEYIGTYNKLIFLDNLGYYTIINESAGHWDKLGNWYSNDSYKKVNTYVYAGNKKVYKTNYIKDDHYLDEWDNFNDEENYWDIFEEVCKVYGLNPMNVSSDKEIEYFIGMNNCTDIYSLHKLLTIEENA